MSTLKTTLSGYATYRGREGHISFLIHRITGLGTLLFLAIHIVDTAFVYFKPEWYEHAIELYRSVPFMIGEIGLVFSLIFHGINGLRIAYFDLFKPKMWGIEPSRKSVIVTLVVSTILWIPPALVMGYNLLHHGFGLFGG